VLSPRSVALSLMCSYCRSRFGLDPLGMLATFRLDRLGRWPTPELASTQVAVVHSAAW
jgi:hypothetical protein